MSDMLVKLYDLPPLAPVLRVLAEQGIRVRRAMAPEKYLLADWIRTHFQDGWASEFEVTFARVPISSLVAVREQQILGFACYDAIRLGFFGPTGVDESLRGKGIGRGLLIATLHAQAEAGYGYSIIGGVGPADFYSHTVGARLIEDSAPGVYEGLLS